MAKISATWRRTVQVRQFESETLELGVEQSVADNLGGDSLVAMAAGLDRVLAEAGDVLVLERLRARQAPSAPAPSGPVEPDDIVR